MRRILPHRIPNSKNGKFEKVIYYIIMFFFLFCIVIFCILGTYLMTTNVPYDLAEFMESLINAP